MRARAYRNRKDAVGITVTLDLKEARAVAAGNDGATDELRSTLKKLPEIVAASKKKTKKVSA